MPSGTLRRTILSIDLGETILLCVELQKRFRSSGFDFSGILKPIYNCSQEMNNLKTMVVDGKTVAYTECPINQGQ